MQGALADQYADKIYADAYHELGVKFNVFLLYNKHRQRMGDTP